MKGSGFRLEWIRVRVMRSAPQLKKNMSAGLFNCSINMTSTPATFVLHVHID